MAMMDKIGREIRTGDVVRISGAYFKNDNGIWFVDRSPGDRSWLGSDYSLHRLNKNGTLSTRVDQICFWPISVFPNSWDKRAMANAWNREHAEIEIIDNVDRGHVRDHFIEMAADLEKRIEREIWNYGESSPVVANDREIAAHYKAVAASIT